MTESQSYQMPSSKTFENVLRLAVREDKPVMYDYWIDSCEKECFIGIKESGDKLLVRSADEYTSPIVKVYKCDSEYIIVTENSIYVVRNHIDTAPLSSA